MHRRRPGLVEQRGKRVHRFAQFLRIAIGGDSLRIIIIRRLDGELRVGVGLAEFRAPAESHPGRFRGIAVHGRQLRCWRCAKLDRVDLADVAAGPPRVDAIDAVGREPFAHEKGEPALAPVRRRIVDPRRVTATRIEQDRIFEFLFDWILVRRVNVVDHHASFRPARTIRIAAVVGGAEHHFAARLEAALACDVERRVGLRHCAGECEGGDHEAAHAMSPE